jgi:spore germination protein GerM
LSLPRSFIAALGIVVGLALFASAGPRHEAELYFPGPRGIMGKEKRSLPPTETTRELVRALFEALVWGPEDKSLAPALPPGAKLRSLFIMPGGLVILDLEGEPFRRHPTGCLKELDTIRSLVFTLLKNVPAATRVKLLVDGDEARTLLGHVSIEKPLTEEDLLTGGIQ